jgi:hypothetical protein
LTEEKEMLSHITITGADDSVDPTVLSELSRRFPSVEWGILFSVSQAGKPRFPSTDWIKNLKNVLRVSLSAHLCGAFARETFDGNDLLHDTFGTDLINKFDRMQLNLPFEAAVRDLSRLERRLQEWWGRAIILQTRAPIAAAEALVERPRWPSRTWSFSLLFDPSGGRGSSPAEWPTPTMNGFGFAGGLRPDNLEQEFPRIMRVAGKSLFWIDVESGVRDENNQFDLSKVTRFLELAEKLEQTIL